MHRPVFRFSFLKPLAGTVLLLGVGSCTPQPTSLSLSSGLTGGYYHRLGEQIQTSGSTVKLSVQNHSSQGSRQNLERLLQRQTNFALVQLDVASEAMRQGQVQAIATLADEYMQIITRQDGPIRSLLDLQGKRVAIGSPGSGIRFTAQRLLQATQLTVTVDDSNLDQALQRLRDRQIDAVIYVGSLGASERLRQQFMANPTLTLLPLPPALINHLTVTDPASYRSATLPVGTYTAQPPVPVRDVSTFSTSTVLVTRPDVDPQQIGLLTWSILSTARTYARFYPEIQNGDAATLLRQGLFYIHPAANEVYEQGDPRAALVRYWERNNDLQAGLFILVGTTVLGLVLQQWRRQRSKKMLAATALRISELRELLPEHPQQALRGIEDLSQEHRLRFIDGLVTPEIYEELRQKTQTFADQCLTQLDEQRRRLVMDTLLLLDEWQATLQTDPEVAMQKLGQIKQQYREMLLSGQVDIEAYIELMELTLMSIMTLMPKDALSSGVAKLPRPSL